MRFNAGYGDRNVLWLRDYTTDQLIEELARRANLRQTNKPKQWCEDCAHFVCWLDGPTPTKDCPDNYNPCAKRHEMRFLAPDEIGDSWGFFRRICADRKPLEQTKGQDDA